MKKEQGLRAGILFLLPVHESHLERPFKIYIFLPARFGLLKKRLVTMYRTSAPIDQG